MTLIIVLIVLFSAALIALVIWLAVKSMGLRTVSGKEGMIDEEGEVISVLPDGKAQVKVHGEIWKADAEGELSVGDTVVVTEVAHLKITVKKKG